MNDPHAYRNRMSADELAIARQRPHAAEDAEPLPGPVSLPEGYQLITDMTQTVSPRDFYTVDGVGWRKVSLMWLGIEIGKLRVVTGVARLCPDCVGS